MGAASALVTCLGVTSASAQGLGELGQLSVGLLGWFWSTVSECGPARLFPCENRLLEVAEGICKEQSKRRADEG
ncbi:MAG: hypothetical protein KC492_05325 [Myxococcales bacterium]|nr:hypothetical protein [Myxococcales bacterium]